MLVRWARVTAGFALLIVGIIGWIMPILPGWPLVIPGLILLGKEYHWARRLLDRFKKLVPSKKPRQ